MPNTSTPFAILTHCIGLTRYWLGTVIAGRQIPRDRDAEFSARGTVADLRQAVQQVHQEIQADITHVQGDQPSAFPAAVRPQHKAWTQGHFLLQCYKELAQHHGHMELTRDIMLGRGPCMVKKQKHFVHKAFRDLAFTLPTAYLPQRCHASYA